MASEDEDVIGLERIKQRGVERSGEDRIPNSGILGNRGLLKVRHFRPGILLNPSSDKALTDFSATHSTFGQLYLYKVAGTVIVGQP